MTFSVSDYLLRRLESLGARHLFAIPGDYILPLFDRIAHNGVTHVAACNELNAGFAADGYARLAGLGAVAATYGVGSLSLVNPAAGALAERVPVVFISGGPPTDAYRTGPVMHHTLPGNFDASLNVFRQVTTHAVRLDDAESAPAMIDEALEICLRESRPVYLEIPQDVQTHSCDPPAERDFPRGPQGSEKTVSKAVDWLARRITSGDRTVVLAGHEIHRWGLQEAVTELIEKASLPVASMFIGKADFLERHPNCIGAYQGAGSLPQVRDFVEAADTVLFLGCVPADFNLGGFTAKLDERQMVIALDDRLTAEDRSFDEVPLQALVKGLLESLPKGAGGMEEAPVQAFMHRPDGTYRPETGTALTNGRLYDRIADFLQDEDIILADAGCAINTTQVQLPMGSRYIAACYWASIGMAFAATLGACFAAAPGQRVVALEGDGSFQMTAQELSTLIRYDMRPIIFVVNNGGYTAERLIHDGAFNDIADWRYHRLPTAFGGVEGEDVRTEDELERALERAGRHSGPGPLLIEVHLDPLDASEAFRLMSEALRSG